MSKATIPKRGDTVTLNDNGLRQCFGSGWQSLGHMKTMRMRITAISEESMTYPEEAYVVEVDNVSINQFMIDHRCFDVVGVR